MTLVLALRACRQGCLFGHGTGRRACKPPAVLYAAGMANVWESALALGTLNLRFHPDTAGWLTCRGVHLQARRTL